MVSAIIKLQFDGEVVVANTSAISVAVKCDLGNCLAISCWKVQIKETTNIIVCNYYCLRQLILLNKKYIEFYVRRPKFQFRNYGTKFFSIIRGEKVFRNREKICLTRHRELGCLYSNLELRGRGSHCTFSNTQPTYFQGLKICVSGFAVFQHTLPKETCNQLEGPHNVSFNLVSFIENDVLLTTHLN